MSNIEIPYKFHCRPYQIPVWDALEAGTKKVVCCWHRGAGKDLFALNYLIYKMVSSPPAVYLHCFPKYNQGKRAIWTSVHATDDGGAMAYLDHIPQCLIKSKNSSDMRIELINGAIYCVMGIDGKNATQARGMNPSFVILSEYAYMDPESWSTLEPRVVQNNGTALFLSTPNGQNHFYHLYNYAATGESKEHFASLMTINETQTLVGKTVEQHMEDLRREGIPEDFIQQEYYCSFTRGAEGSYYGKQIQEARSDGRITTLRLSPDIPVDTAWDIGVGDSTSIYFVQRLPNNKINVLHYYENHGEGLEHYLRYLDRWKERNRAIYGMHFVPHDMRVMEFGGGEKRIDVARKLGYNMTVVTRNKIEEGIQAVRATLPHCSFDSVECKKGINCLDFYRKKWNESLKVYYDEPLHDQYSHGCFPKGTQISMKEGVKKIEDIVIGDIVKTPTGYCRVSYLHKYKTKELVNISTEKGKFSCTRNHKIFSERGLIYADELCYTDSLISNSTRGNDICQKYLGIPEVNTDVGFRETFLSMRKKIGSYSIKNKDRVVGCVQQNLEEEIDVYDFEVEKDHCYYANGFLVSNSDAFRYLCCGIREFGNSTTLSKNSIEEMRMKHRGY